MAAAVMDQLVDDVVSAGEVLKDDTPGVSGEVMLVNTDSFEECNHELDTTTTTGGAAPGHPSPPPPSPITQQMQVKELVEGVGNMAVADYGEKAEPEDTMQDLGPDEDGEEENIDEEYLQSTDWLQKEKHVFILSESGKPIYTRYGKEDRLVTLFGLMQALVSFVADSDDVIRCIVAGEHKFVFLVRSPLILVAVSHSVASIAQLLMQLTGYLYGHVSYLADDCEACLLLLSVDREQFFTLSEAKQKIVSDCGDIIALKG
ncbi:hypothetical protein OTU49_012464 [Cherax quadricarinatus]|uniref:Vacuolar fusion protein MON1 homolog n=1 Tax=Cherax quadricarinatus TaxID=27406 RepID=A0AAW0VYT3_CHEQU